MIFTSLLREGAIYCVRCLFKGLHVVEYVGARGERPHVILPLQFPAFAAASRLQGRGILAMFLREGDFRPRASLHLPAFPLENFRKFIEKPREFIDIYRIFRKFHIFERSDRLRRRTGIPLVCESHKCGQMRVVERGKKTRVEGVESNPADEGLLKTLIEEEVTPAPPPGFGFWPSFRCGSRPQRKGSTESIFAFAFSPPRSAVFSPGGRLGIEHKNERRIL